MSGDTFYLQWNNHKQILTSNLQKLLCSKQYVDATLVSEGHQIPCHRMILSASSRFFDSIFQETGPKHPIVILPSEIKLWHMQALVDYMYRGEVTILKSGLTGFLKSAEILKIRGLYDVAKSKEECKTKKEEFKPEKQNIEADLGDSTHSDTTLRKTENPTQIVTSTANDAPAVSINSSERGNDANERNMGSIQVSPPTYQERGPILNNTENYMQLPSQPLATQVSHTFMMGLLSTDGSSKNHSGHFQNSMIRRFPSSDYVLNSGSFYSNEMLMQVQSSSTPSGKRTRRSQPQQLYPEPPKNIYHGHLLPNTYPKLPPLKRNVVPKNNRSSAKNPPDNQPFQPFHILSEYGPPPMNIPRSPLPPALITHPNRRPPLYYPDLSGFSNTLKI